MSGGFETGARRRRRAPWGILALGLLFAACDDDGGEAAPTPDGAPAADMGPGRSDAAVDDGPDEPDGPDAAVGWVELGTGTRRFEALEPGQEVPIIQGIQGGYHVWGGFRGGGFDDSDVRLRFWLDLGDTTLGRADYSEFGLPPSRTDADVYDYAGVAVVYESNDDVVPTAGRTMTLRIEVSSMGDGQVMTDSVEVVPICCE